MISFGTGIIVFILAGLLLWGIAIFISKKWSGNAALGGVFGFFIAFAAFIIPFLMAGRLYVVKGDADYEHYFVFSMTDYTTKSNKVIDVDIHGTQCMVINDWEKPVVVEFVIYGGFGFGGDTEFVQPDEGRYFEENKVYYFYDEEPPSEITIKTDEDKVRRLWLRNKR